MSGIFYFNQFQLDVLHTRLSTKKPVAKEEAGAIAKLLEVEKNKVYKWFHNKPVLKTPQIYLSGAEFNKDELAKELGMAPKQVDRWFRNQKRKGVPDKRRRKREFEKHNQMISQLKRNQGNLAFNFLDSADNKEGVSGESMANSEDWFSRMGKFLIELIFEEDFSTNYFSDHALPMSSFEDQNVITPNQEFQYQPMDQEHLLEEYETTFKTANTYLPHSVAPNIHSAFTSFQSDPNLNQFWPSEQNSTESFMNLQSSTVYPNCYDAAHYPTTDYNLCLPPPNLDWVESDVTSSIHQPYHSTQSAPTISNEFQNYDFEI
ncbi:hypothetical protein CAEBREN_09485 [Caenorhabditis brenneri]|uniref:Homeobox domain-containing protein n=1 Tax=Caenorhabditis brenneri TaxID=135651 RepID=G0P067_CAEBE|nr:hypothetical protein CAEBREN_09485 [Caenorhabditis brenneri]